MKSLATSSTRRLLIAAVVALAPVGSALAAQDSAGDPFAPYQQAFGDRPVYERGPVPRSESGARGPAGPIMTAEDPVACRNDPHRRIQEQLWGDGPSYECMAVDGERAGARGPAGPLMEEEPSSTNGPFGAYNRAFTGD